MGKVWRVSAAVPRESVSRSWHTSSLFEKVDADQTRFQMVKHTSALGQTLRFIRPSTCSKLAERSLERSLVELSDSESRRRKLHDTIWIHTHKHGLPSFSFIAEPSICFLELPWLCKSQGRNGSLETVRSEESNIVIAILTLPLTQSFYNPDRLHERHQLYSEYTCHPVLAPYHSSPSRLPLSVG